MLHFFRKIRRDLLANSQFFKYLKYAVGEIVLVVLGILIALYINNQNEERKEQEKFNEILVEVEAELIWNTYNAFEGVKALTVQDSLCSEILYGGLKREQLDKDTLKLYRSFFDTWGFTIEDKAFKKLMDIENGLNEEQLSISKMLSNLYNKDSIQESRTAAVKSEDLYYKTMESFKRHDWYVDLILNQPYGENEIEFYLNDPEFKKIAAEYSLLTTRSHLSRLQLWFQKYLKSYLSVYQYLEKNDLQHNDSLHFRYNPMDYKYVMGRYKLVQWDSYGDNWFEESTAEYGVIDTVNNMLNMTRYKNDGFYSKAEIYPISKSCFISTKYPSTGYYRFHFNEMGEVSDFVYKIANVRFKNKKIH
ncbi:hypothetical protein [Lutimonas zeaxanthinifaciens]|uniref:hypothetical protein n=1 Tax=Lutimonas zeaxanthinifaciens TaxID=3060215 RepID=UPI00265D46E8|nr:hypothetical protein [Lutimonas sp. YSD2104]WKK66515.1 hypothetical protein QZH61_02575 [Lutimonas sp. YSD2104]